VKDKNNIEELFRDKFEGFEGHVDPSAWANIQQSLANGAAATSGAVSAGLSSIAKVAIIAGLVSVTSVAAWYFSSDNMTAVIVENTIEENTKKELPIEEIEKVQTIGNNILVNDTNDPVIQDRVIEISEDLNHTQYNSESIDNELVESILSNHSINNGLIVNQNSGNGNPVVNDNNSGNIKNELKVKDDNSIVSNRNPENGGANLEVHEPIVNPEIKCNLKYSFSEEDGNIVSFKSNAKNHNNVSWVFGDGTEEIGDDVIHAYERPGTYELEMTVSSGDGQVDYIKRKIIIEGTSSLGAIANVFTPNGDGRNDYFFIQSEGLEIFYVSIKNERGEEVYSSNDPNFEWNGQHQDGSTKKGGYIVVIIAEGEDGQVFKEMKALRIE
jgi:hypothetical protein